MAKKKFRLFSEFENFVTFIYQGPNSLTEVLLKTYYFCIC